MLHIAAMKEDLRLIQVSALAGCTLLGIAFMHVSPHDTDTHAYKGEVVQCRYHPSMLAVFTDVCRRVHAWDVLTSKKAVGLSLCRKADKAANYWHVAAYYWWA